VARRKGISPVVATLLLIVVAVVSVFVLWLFLGGFFARSSASTGSLSVQGVAAKNYNPSGKLASIVVTLQATNSYSGQVTITNVELLKSDGTPIPPKDSISVNIPAGRSATLTAIFNDQTKIEDLPSYSVRVTYNEPGGQNRTIIVTVGATG